MAEVSALNHLNNLLEKKPQVIRQGSRVIVEWIKLEPFSIRIPRQVSVPYEYMDFPRVIDSSVVVVRDLVFDKVRLTEIPQSGLLTKKTIHNCGDTTVTSSIGLSIAGTQSWSVTKTAGVNTTMGASVTGSVGTPGVAGGSVTLNFSQTFSTSTAVQEGGSSQVTRTSNESITVGPKRAVLIELFAFQAGAEIPFSASIIIDGTLEPNLSGISKASDLIPEADRTLPLEGVLRLADVSQANLRTTDLGGAQGCDVALALSEIQETLPPIPAVNLGSYFEGFRKQADMDRLDGTLHATQGSFGKHVWTLNNDGPTIGPPDGTSYEVLYTTQSYEPSAACGFNDLGLMNTAIFNVEARQYRTYAKGQLVTQWQDYVKTFASCLSV